DPLRAFEANAGLARDAVLLDASHAVDRAERFPHVGIAGESRADDRRAGAPSAQLVRSPLADDLSPVDDQHAVADRLHLGEDVRRQEDGPIPAELADELADLDDLFRIE